MPVSALSTAFGTRRPSKSACEPAIRARSILPPALLLVLVAVAEGRSAAPGRTSDPSRTRPDIVLFITDDHRADMLGCAGHPFLLTPNIDRLAAEGVRHANAFVTTSICAASRASILTGVVERTHRYTFGTPPLAVAWCEASYPARLRAAGYHTGHIGKFGVTLEAGGATRDGMYDQFISITQPYLRRDADGTERHATDLIGEAAAEFVKRSPTDRPFCLTVAFNAAHAVDGDLENHFPPPPTERDLYADIEMPRPRLDGDDAFAAEPPHLRDSMNRDRWFWRWDQPEKYDRNLRNHLRMITGLDRNIGRVLEAIADRGTLDETVVVVVGDNGFHLGERGFAGKWSHHEESLRVPLIVRDPRRRTSTGGEVSYEIALNIDLAPTLLAAVGLEPGPSMQGRVLSSVAGAPDAAPREDFYCEHRMRHPRIPRWEGLRSGEWKYARYLDVPGAPEHLYQLSEDPLEQRDLSGDPEFRARLESMRRETARRSAAYRDAGRPLPRVLLLGDSISMGYHDSVVRRLDDEAVVLRPLENCAGTTRGATEIERWLEDAGEVDVIHFNFGLHDLKRVDEQGRNSNDPQSRRQADLDTYRRQLRGIARRLVATGSQVVFATTTPVPTGGVSPHRDPADVLRYNACAREVLAPLGVEVFDLHAVAKDRLPELQKPRDVHFTAAGSEVLGASVADAVRRALRRATASQDAGGSAGETSMRGLAPPTVRGPINR
jgi:arylsulfatase A-like enzyme